MYFWTNIAIYFLLTCYVLDCAFMGLVILMQRSKQEGLGAAFGGGFTDAVFGAQTSQVLVKATVWAAIIFFGLSITLARLYSHLDASAEKGSPVQQLLSQPVKASAVKPVPAPTPVPAAEPMPVPVAMPPPAPEMAKPGPKPNVPPPHLQK